MPHRTVHGVLKVLHALAAAALLAAAFPASGATPSLVKDLNTNGEGGQEFGGFTLVGDAAYFVGCNRTHGCELWKSDGTTAGTRLFKDTRPGDSFIGTLEQDTRPMNLVNVGGTLFFSARTDTTGRELWKSDGTTEGTVLVKDIANGADSSSPSVLTAWNGKLWFAARDSMSTSQALWFSDGTANGTEELFAAPNTNGSYLQMIPAGDLLYFVFRNNSFGDQLWRTDGTTAGTRFLGTISSNNGVPYRMAALGNVLMFNAAFGNAEMLWRSDGTFIGTSPLKSVRAGCGASDLRTFAVLGAFLYFVGDEAATGCELWRTDGTEAGTQLVFDMILGTTSGYPQYLTQAGGALYFAGNGPGGAAATLWKSDGTPGGTVPVKDIAPQFGLPVSGITAVSNAVVFAGAGSLWTSDGTPAGTVVVKNMGGVPSQFVGGPTRAYFSFNDGSSFDADPWASDLTTNGTLRLVDLWAGTATSAPSVLSDVGGSLYFIADDINDGGRRGLWRSDGTEAGTARIPNPQPGLQAFLGGAGSTAYFMGGSRLYRTTNGSVPVEVVQNLSSGSASPDYAALGGTMIFSASAAGSSDFEPWKTDGTPGGTSRIVDLNGGPSASSPSQFRTVGNGVYFTTNAPFGIWKTDGTPGGTVSIRSGVGFFGAVGDKILFTDSGLFVADGTPGGTQQIANVSPRAFASADGVTYFSLGAGGVEQLWKTDGTAAGTVLVKEVGTNLALISNLVGAGPNVFFFVEPETGGLGYTLWHSNGTEAGTLPIATFPRLPVSLARSGSTLYFAISDGVNGTELWKSDGTPAGTVIAAETAPGTGDSKVANLRVSGSRLYFTAQSEATATEVFAIVLDGLLDPFSFAGATGVATGSTVTSAAVTLSGSPGPLAISVANGEYSIGCTATFVSTAGVIQVGQSVCVRHVASALTDATTTTLLTVGSYTTSFTSKTVANVLTNPRLFAAQQYRDFLGREGETAGIDFYEQQIAIGAMTQRQVIEVFLASPEFQTGLPQMIRLYFAFFNRIPDFDGLMFQVAAYRSGAPIDGIALNFSLAPEFQATYGTLTDEQYVDLVYQNVLGRAPDPEGRQFYLDRLGDGRLTRGSMMIGFSESPEYQQLLDAEVYVISVYVGMLHRTPEPAGLQFYVDAIDNGLVRNTIIEGFLGSPEYRGRFLP